MEEPVSEASDEQIPEEGGEDETGVIPPAADEPAAPADPAPGAPADEPAPETPVEEPAPETPVEEEADAPAEEAPAEQPAEEVPVVDEEPAEETPVEEAAPADNYDINNVEIMVDEPAAAKVTITFDKFDAIRQNVKIEASTATPDDYKTIRKAGLVVNKNATVKIKLTPVAGFAIDTVKAGTAEQTGTADGTAKVYTVTPEANVTLAITAYPVYTVTLKDAADTAATGLSIKIEDSLKDAVVGSSDAKLTVAADGTATVKNAADKDFSFTLTSTALTDAKAIVSYSTEKEGSQTVITPKEVEKKEGQTTTKINVYTVEKSVIANLDGALFIHLKKETASTVTVGTGDAVGNNADVNITVPGKTAAEGAALDATNGKAFIGDTFKFKVALKDAVKDTKTIAKVAVKATGDAKPTTIEAEDGVYSFEVKGNTTITVTTAYKDAASHLFKFTLASGSAEGSAEVAVKNIIVTKDNTDTTYVASGSDPNKNITTYPNMPTNQKLEVGEVLRLPNADDTGATIKSITFTVTPVATKGYELAPLEPENDSEDLTTRDITFVAGTATTGQTALAASGTENAITVGTQVKKSAGDVYFLPSTTDENLTINVPSGAGTKVEKIMDTGENADKVKAYKIASGEQRATFTVTAKAGHTLVKDDLTETNGVGSVTEETGSNGDITYTVTLFPSLITGTSASSVKEYTLTSEEPHFTAVMESPVEANSGDYNKLFEITSRKFTAPATTEEPNPAATAVNNTANTNKGNIVYGSKLEIVITGKNGHTITGLTYTMGGAAGTAAPKIEEAEGTSKATLTIPKVTGNVLFSVTTDESVYKLTKLQVLSADGTTASDVASADYIGEDDRYLVNHEKSYLVNIEKDGAALDKAATKDLTAAVTATKDGKTTAVRQSRKEFATGGLVIDFANKGLAGAEVKIEVSYDGDKVGVYNLTVSKETSEISVNDGKTIEQQVDSVKTYEVKTDGVLDGDLVISKTNNIIKSATLDKENKILTITTAPAATADLKTGNDAKTDTITIKAADNTDVECEVKVTATSFFDKAKTVTVEETSNAVADTVIGVTLTTGDVLKAGYKAPEAGSLWYEVKAEAAANKSDAADAPAFSTVADKMVGSVTKYYKVKGASQREQIVVGQNTELGTGTDWPYTISAKLVYLNAEPEGTPDADDIAAAVETTTTAKEAKISTKSPTFTAALKLQKVSKKEGGVTEVYTGQSGEMIIAQPTFKDKGFTANYQVVKSDISDLTSYGDLTFGVNAKGQIVVTSVSPTAKIGKHTITVTARADETPGHPMYASKATTTINVVKGINKIDITQPGTVIYAGDPKKVASMKLGVNYNASDNGSWDVKGKKYITAPKKKSLEWSVVAREDDKEVPVSDTIAKYVTVDKKNGTIKVAKGFTPSSHAAENRFYVKAVAKDFEGNVTYDYSEQFTVATEKLEIATLALVKHSDEKYNVVKVDSSAWNRKTPVEVTPAEVNGSTLFLFPAGVTVEEKEYLDSAWDKLTKLNPADFTFKSSAAKVVSVSSTGYLGALGAKKKVTITATANDGGKKKNSIVLNVDYDSISAPRLKISAKAETDAADIYSVSVCSGTDAPDGTNKVKKNIEHVTGAARLKVQVLTKGEGDAYVNASNNANYKLTVKGGSIDKVMSSTNGTKYINTAAKTVTLTLTDNTTKPKKTVYTYELTNKAYELTTKAPKVKVTGSLYEYAKDAEQNVKINVKNADGTPAAYAKIEVDWTSKTAKNAEMLNRLDTKMKANTELKHVFKLNDNEALGAKGDVDLTFKDLCKDYYLTPGSYKLKVTVVNASGAAQGLPTTATLKVVKSLKFTYKPTTSYTISKAEGGVMLTGKSSVKKGARADVYWSNLRNANVKGVSNNFTKFFTLVYDAETKTTMLKATDLFWAAQKGDTTLGSGQSAVTVPKFDPKNDLTGYVTCSASADKSFYNSEYYSEDVKLTIKLAKDLTKPAAKYAVNKPDVLLSGADAKTAVNVKIGNEFVKIGYAVPNSAKAASKELELVNDGGRLGVNTKGQVEVKVKSGVTLTEKKSYSIEIKALPANSVYAAAIVAGGAGRAIAAGSADDMYSMSANTPAVPEPTTPEGIADKYGVPVKITVRGMSKPVNVTPDPVIPAPPVEKEDFSDETIDFIVENVSLTAVNFTGTWVNATTSLTDAQRETIITEATELVNMQLGEGMSIKTLTKDDVVNGRANAQSAEGGVKVTLTKAGYNDKEFTIYFAVNVTGGGSGTTSNTVTISGAENCTVTWAAVEKNATAPTEITTAVTNNTISVEAGKDLYLKVVAKTGYTVKTVKKGEDEQTGNNGVYKIGEITAATTVTITAEEDSSSSI